jgi:polyribonucleotide nucleotidyltransferase
LARGWDPIDAPSARQVPDTPAVISDIIGKHGSIIDEIQKKSASMIKIEK